MFRFLILVCLTSLHAKLPRDCSFTGSYNSSRIIKKCDCLYLNNDLNIFIAIRPSKIISLTQIDKKKRRAQIVFLKTKKQIPIQVQSRKLVSYVSFNTRIKKKTIRGRIRIPKHSLFAIKGVLFFSMRNNHSEKIDSIIYNEKEKYYLKARGKRFALLANMKSLKKGRRKSHIQLIHQKSKRTIKYSGQLTAIVKYNKKRKSYFVTFRGTIYNKKNNRLEIVGRFRGK